MNCLYFLSGFFLGAFLMFLLCRWRIGLYIKRQGRGYVSHP